MRREWMHLSEEQVQRVLHGELASATAREVDDHLEACPECRALVDRAEQEERWLLDRLGALDHPVPAVRAGDIVRSRSRRGWGQWAAGIFLGAALAGAAYAIPGSPLPGVIARIVGSQETRGSSTVTAEPSDSVVVQAGIAVAPGSRLTISFETAVAGDTAVVSLSDSGDVVIQGRGGISSFTSDPERVAIHREGGAGRFDIFIPRSAPLVTLEVGTRRILIKRASRVTADAPPDRQGRYVVPLISP